MSGGAHPSGAPLREHAGRVQILDPVRRRWVALTPEEGVRQSLLADLLARGYPAGLLAVEKALDVGHAVWRADVVAFGRDGRPLLVAECKAPAVPVSQATFDQLARYNAALGARALVADDGRTRYCCRLGPDGWAFQSALPRYADLA